MARFFGCPFGHTTKVNPMFWYFWPFSLYKLYRGYKMKKRHFQTTENFSKKNLETAHARTHGLVTDETELWIRCYILFTNGRALR